MSYEQLTAQVVTKIKTCTDEPLLDLMLKLLIESGY